MTDFASLGSDFEALAAREANRLSPDILKPVIVRSFSDIQRVVAEFAPEKQVDGVPVTITTTLRGEAESGKSEDYNVVAVTKSRSRRSMILEAFDVLRRYQEYVESLRDKSIPILVNGVEMCPPAVATRDPAIYIDPLIKHWMGGDRKEFLICWNLSDGYTYRYDIIAHRLNRMKR